MRTSCTHIHMRPPCAVAGSWADVPCRVGPVPPLSAGAGNNAALTNCTLGLIKPHAVAQGIAGDILQAVLDEGFEVSAIGAVALTTGDAEDFLEVYKGVVPEYRPRPCSPPASEPHVCKETPRKKCVKFGGFGVFWWIPRATSAVVSQIPGGQGALEVVPLWVAPSPTHSTVHPFKYSTVRSKDQSCVRCPKLRMCGSIVLVTLGAMVLSGLRRVLFGNQAVQQFISFLGERRGGPQLEEGHGLACGPWWSSSRSAPAGRWRSGPRTRRRPSTRPPAPAGALKEEGSWSKDPGVAHSRPP